jgi:hypothetical protein
VRKVASTCPEIVAASSGYTSWSSSTICAMVRSPSHSCQIEKAVALSAKAVIHSG